VLILDGEGKPHGLGVTVKKVLASQTPKSVSGPRKHLDHMARTDSLAVIFVNFYFHSCHFLLLESSHGSMTVNGYTMFHS
jgi:hypothetical protein